MAIEAQATWLKQIEGRVFTNEPLSQYTSWKTGGVADFLYIPDSVDDLQSFLTLLPHEVPLTILGLGSNCLALDGGVRGGVVVMQGSGLNKLALVSETKVVAQAGVACGKFARFCARNNCESAEFMAGIPGTIGGALAMNAGCYGSETWEFVQSVETINRQGEIKVRPVTDFHIEYRYVKGGEDEFFLSATFEFKLGSKENALANIKKLLAKRNESQPTNYPNCGSVFRNPPGQFAAQLIESCGLKGFRIGGAEVSEKHANFIINLGGATSREILEVIMHVQSVVLEKTGVELVREAKVIGELS